MEMLKLLIDKINNKLATGDRVIVTELVMLKALLPGALKEARQAVLDKRQLQKELDLKKQQEKK